VAHYVTAKNLGFDKSRANAIGLFTHTWILVHSIISMFNDT